MPEPVQQSPHRRAVLSTAGTGLVLLGLVGCSSAAGDTAARSGTDAHLRRRAAASTSRLLAHYRATTRKHRGLSTRLTPLQHELNSHLAAFRSASSEQADASSPAEDDASPHASPHGTPPPSVPDEQHDALTALSRASRQAAKDRIRDLDEASGGLAQLLASASGCLSGHALLLRSST